MQRIATAMLVAALQDCSFGPDTKLELEVDSTDPAVVEATAPVLAARFEQAQPSMLSTTRFVVEDSKVRFTFRNGSPEPRIVQRLYQTPGRFRAALATAVDET